MQELYSIIFSEKQDARKLLYTLGDRNFASGVTVSFDTYFNSFYPQDWVRLTTLQDLRISLTAKGKGKLKVFGFRKIEFGYVKDLIFEVEFENQISKEIPYWQSYQMIYPVVESISKIEDLNISYATKDSYPNKELGLGIVICTYRKEWYVTCTLEKLSKLKFNHLKFQIIIVDNAKTLSKDLETHYKNLTILPNKNLGGSGGFTKGIFHCYETPSITHILLMDDDIELDEKVLKRIESFLLFLKEEKTCMAGNMLDAQIPNLLYETNTDINFSQMRSYTRNFLSNLSDTNHLLKVSEHGEIQHGAWWLFLFPKKALKETQFPIPFFIRGDDIEFSYRLKQHGYNVERINALAIWHEPFELRITHWVYYYTWRNLLIISALYSKGSHFIRSVFLYLYGIYFISTFQYGILEYILDGISDFLKGPKYLQNLNAEEFHQSLVKKVDLDYVESSLNLFGTLEEKKLNYFQKFLAIFNLLTLNFFLVKGTYKATVFLNSGRLNTGTLTRLALSMGAEEIQVMIPSRGRMRNYTKNPKRAMKLFIKLIKMTLQLFFQFKKVEKLWKKESSYLISIEFWKEYLR